MVDVPHGHSAQHDAVVKVLTEHVGKMRDSSTMDDVAAAVLKAVANVPPPGTDLHPKPKVDKPVAGQTVPPHVDVAPAKPALHIDEPKAPAPKK
jgi:hypothetical protein